MAQACAPTQISRVTADRIAKINDQTIIAEVKISEMILAPYCRVVSTAQLGRMLASGFDERKLGIITLSMRKDGLFAILDGNHRRHIAASVGKTSMLARVFIDLTYEEEAELYVALNTVKPPTALENFKGRLHYREPVALGITSLLEKHGLRIQFYSGQATPGSVTCVYALERLYTEQSPKTFEEVISILRDAWDYDRLAYTGRMVDGIRLFWIRYQQHVDRKRLIDILKLNEPARVLARARTLQDVTSETGASLIGQEIMRLYNGRAVKNRLPEWVERVRNPTLPPSVALRNTGREVAKLFQAPGEPEEKP